MRPDLGIQLLIIKENYDHATAPHGWEHNHSRMTQIVPPVQLMRCLKWKSYVEHNLRVVFC